MFIPYSVDVPMERLPITNWVLIGITTAVSIVVLAGTYQQTFRPDIAVLEGRRIEQDQDKTMPLALVPARFSFGQLFTHQFVHANIIHLIGNMIFSSCSVMQ